MTAFNDKGMTVFEMWLNMLFQVSIDIEGHLNTFNTETICLQSEIERKRTNAIRAALQEDQRSQIIAQVLYPSSNVRSAKSVSEYPIRNIRRPQANDRHSHRMPGKRLDSGKILDIYKN
jgi:hypothetical protein